MTLLRSILASGLFLVLMLGLAACSDSGGSPSTRTASNDPVPIGDVDPGLEFDSGDDDPADGDDEDGDDGEDGGEDGGDDGEDDGDDGGDEAPVPEPGTLILLGGGLAALAVARRRKQHRPPTDAA